MDHGQPLTSRVSLMEIAPIHGQSIRPSLGQGSFASFLYRTVPKEQFARCLRHQVGHDHFVIDRQRCLTPAQRNIS